MYLNYITYIFRCLSVTDVGGNTLCPWGTYGVACDRNCSERCRLLPEENIVHCDKLSGKCSEGCISGWYADKCNQECSQNCMNNTCNQLDGDCTLGCKDGKQGRFCEVSEDKNDDDEDTTVPLNKASPVLITVVLVIIIVVVIGLLTGYICIHQRRATKRQLIADKESDGLISERTRTRLADTRFHNACEEGNLELVQDMLSSDSIDVNVPGSYGVTPAMWAAQKGHRDVFQFLVDKGADLLLLDVDGDHIFNMACYGGNTEIVESILSKIPDPEINKARKDGRTPLMWAAMQGHLDIFNRLTAKHADLLQTDDDGDNILHYACLGGRIEIVEQVIASKQIDINSTDRYGRTAVMSAARHGHKDILDLLVKNGGDRFHTDNRGKNILHLACLGGHARMVEHVLHMKVADINSRNKFGVTPLMFAAFNGHRSVLDLLLSEGADVSLCGNMGNNILHVACMGGHAGMVKHILSERMVDINSRAQNERTPLMLAAQWERRSVVDFLLEQGADISLTDNRGNSVLHIASKTGYMEIVQDLVSHHTLDINTRNRHGKTAAMTAKRKGNNAVYTYLINMSNA
ncbi:ankyrin repeat domain-containing protein 50-like [Haliotis asinina]|uniref:ankyrin repeat domain-containing protein 50-like n=1 Tax=Haliotis asinina TaxID=109174 RepID=UPI003531DD63